METVADDYHCLHRRLLHFLYRLFEDIGHIDVTTADAADPASLHDLVHVVCIRDPSRCDTGAHLRSPFAAEISEFDLYRPRCEHFGLDICELIPDELIVGLGG